jgi:3-oxoacyl-[acyl-carrier-protein] synthase-3
VRAAALLGLGAHRPAHREDNLAIAARTGSSDEWIRERSGIVTRGVAGPDESVVDMSVGAAGQRTGHRTGGEQDEVHVGCVHPCGRERLAGGAPEVASRLGATRAGASDVGAGCAGFTYALSMAADAVRAGSADRVLVIGAEKLMPMVDPEDRATAFLFGDGAGAAVVGLAETDGIGRAAWANDGEQHERLVIDGSPLRLRMEGRAIYRWATTSLPDLARRACALAGTTPGELAAFVPHQANLRITESVVKALDLPDSVVVARDVVDSGNTSAASVPLALARLHELGQVRRGDAVLLLGFGAGLTAAGQVVRCP